MDFRLNAVQLNTLHQIDIARDETSGKYAGFIDGILKSWNTVAVGGQQNSNFELSLMGTSINTLNPDCNFYSLEIRNNLYIDISNVATQFIGNRYFNTTPHNIHYYKRYREDGNKKLFISSRYLKDAVIDGSNNITSINSELDFDIPNNRTELFCNNTNIKDYAFYQDTEFNHVSTSLTPNIPVSDIFKIGINDFYVGGWFKITKTDLPTYSRFFITLLEYSVGQAGISLGIWENYIKLEIRNDDTNTTNNYYYNISMSSVTDIWHYVTAIRGGYDIYIIFNGSIVYHISETFIANIPIMGTANRKFFGLNYYVNNTNAWYFDDILLSIGNSIINPTGKSIGDKVFEPPRRRSLESEFIQF